MKDTWLKIILIFSLAVNFSVLGALGYPLAKQYWENTTEPSARQEIPPQDVPPQVMQSRSAFRKRMLNETSLLSFLWHSLRKGKKSRIKFRPSQIFREKSSRLSLTRFLRKQPQCLLNKESSISLTLREGCARANVAKVPGLGVEEGE